MNTSFRHLSLEKMPSEMEVAPRTLRRAASVDSTAVSKFVVILVELTNTVFVNSTNTTTNIEMAALSMPACSVMP